MSERETKEPIELRVISKGRYGTTDIEDQFGRKVRNCTDLKIRLNKDGFWEADLTLINFPLDIKIDHDQYSCALLPLPTFKDALKVHFIYLRVIKFRVENFLRCFRKSPLTAFKHEVFYPRKPGKRK